MQDKVGCLARQTSQHKVVLRLILPGLNYLYIHTKDLSPHLAEVTTAFSITKQKCQLQNHLQMLASCLTGSYQSKTERSVTGATTASNAFQKMASLIE
jgi:hypothetical protein